MKRTMIAVLVVAVLAFSGIASAVVLAPAEGFYAATNELGYSGTVWNISEGTGPWTTSSPRDAALYAVKDAPSVSAQNYNILMSNWDEHSTSNQNDSFFQLYDVGNTSVTSMSGGWDAELKTFTVTVSGENASYDDCWSRFWQPDNSGVAWSVLLTNYTYTLTATFADPAVAADGGYKNSGAPLTLEGSFTGEFVPTVDVLKNPITDGDTYGFDIHLSKSLFAPLNGSATVYNDFATVPEPGTIVMLAMAGLGLLVGIWRRRQ
jgi:hypothetical protein